MSEELTINTGIWHSTITSPTTGDAVNQAAWKDGNQDLADNVGYVRERVMGSTAGAGVQRIRMVADLPEMQAITGVTDGDVVLVETRGLYFARSSDDGTRTPFTVASIGTAGKYWYWAGRFSIEEQLGNAMVTTDPVTEQLMRPDVVPNRIVETVRWAEQNADTTLGTYQDITGDTDWHDITSMAVTFTEDLKTGDIVQIRAHIQVCGDGAGTAVFRASVYFDSTEHEVDGSGSYGGTQTTCQAIDCSSSYVMPSDESGVVVKVQGKVSGAGIHTLVGDCGLFLEATAVRP